MRRTLLPAILVFVGGLGIGYFARGAVVGLQRSYAYKSDLASIEKLHQADIDATLSQDAKKLMELWAEDAVRFNPGGPPAVGRQAIASENEKFHAQYPGLKVVSYTSKYRNLQLEGGLACEWFAKEAQYKLSADATPTNWRANGLLVLKRQSDDSWRTVTILEE